MSLSAQRDVGIVSIYQNDHRIKPLLDSFLQRLGNQVEELNDVFVAQDSVSTAKGMLHKLKGACGSYGFPVLYEILSDIEHVVAMRGFEDAEAYESLNRLKQLVGQIQIH